MNTMTISERKQAYLDLKAGIPVKLSIENRIRLLKWIDSEIQRLIFLHASIVGNNPQMKDYQIEQIDEYPHLIRVKQMIEVKLGRKPTKINPQLNLSDILIEGIDIDKVKKYYKNPDENKEYLGMFLRVLKMKGYFKKVTYKQLEIIGRNEFLPDYIDSRNYKPPTNLKTSDFKHIPEPINLLK